MKNPYMKTILLFTCFVFYAFTLHAQADTSKVEQYCILSAQQKLLSSKVNITLEMGEKTSVWKDRRLKDEKGSVIDFNNLVDALNYMGKTGWSLVAAFPVSVGNGQVYEYVFKKRILLSELSPPQ